MTEYEVRLSDGTTKTITARSPGGAQLMIRLQVRDGFLPKGTTVTEIKVKETAR